MSSPTWTTKARLAVIREFRADPERRSRLAAYVLRRVERTASETTRRALLDLRRSVAGSTRGLARTGRLAGR